MGKSEENGPLEQRVDDLEDRNERIDQFHEEEAEYKLDTERRNEIKRQDLLLELDLVHAVNEPRKLGRTEKLIIASVIIFGVVNILLNVLTLGPDLW